MSGTERTSVSLPMDLAEYARAKGKGNTSSYIADLIERDRKRDTLLAMFSRHGYTGDKQVTDDGAATMAARLRDRKRQAAAQREHKAA
ncbi:hypothetical protein [Hamadaea tsunoensis]|uniref:hypothetical protein n=1 Tax=Hamadaea tsunoensis TaxID=53368 RepID=UPI000410A7F3|nr:hypothetical protein [Hamadaea tsunoensis]